MILESIVTTIDPAGRINIAPMGPVLRNAAAMSSCQGGDPGFVLRPFEGSRTFDNLYATRQATIHVTDDATLFARAAIGRLDQCDQLTRRSECGQFVILKHCHRWFTVQIDSVTETPPRYEMNCRLIESGIEAPFFGFNRGKHAVIEAAILATRTHLIPVDELNSQIDALYPLVEKTAGQPERLAFEMLTQEIQRRQQQDAVSGAK